MDFDGLWLDEVRMIRCRLHAGKPRHVNFRQNVNFHLSFILQRDIVKGTTTVADFFGWTMVCLLHQLWPKGNKNARKQSALSPSVKGQWKTLDGNDQKPFEMQHLV